MLMRLNTPNKKSKVSERKMGLMCMFVRNTDFRAATKRNHVHAHVCEEAGTPWFSGGRGKA